MMAYRLLAAAAAAALVAGLVAAGMWFVRVVSREPVVATPSTRATDFITISKSTTYFTEPLTADGQVDFAAALNGIYGRDIAPEDNAAVALWQIVPSGDSEPFREQVYKLWGIEAVPEAAPLLVPETEFWELQSIEALEAYDAEQVAIITAMWKADDYPTAAAWIEGNQAALAATHDAVQRPKYFLPAILEDYGQLTRWGDFVTGVHDLGRLLITRAMLRLGSGQYDEAWDDLLTAARLGRLMGQGIVWTEQRAGHAVQGTALTGMFEFLEAAPLDAQQAQTYRAALAELPLRSSLADAMNHDIRIFTINCVLSSATDPQEINSIAKMEELDPADAAWIWKADFNSALRVVNRRYDRCMAVLRMEFGPDRLRQAETLEDQLQSQKPDLKGVVAVAKHLASDGDVSQFLGEELGKYYAYRMSLDISDLVVFDTTIGQQRVLVDTGLALAAWRADHGEFPRELSDLVPDYLPELPRDYFSEDAVRYARTPSGYVLYSVGENGIDESGRDVRSSNGECDDIALRIEQAVPAN